MLTLNFAPLKHGKHVLTFAPDAEAVGVDPTQFSDLQVRVEMDYQARQIWVNMTASAQAALLCDRTLAPYTEKVTGQYEVLFLFGSDGTEAEVEDVQVLAVGTTELDLTALVRDTLLLALPQRRVAPAAQDLDLPTSFGSADSIDPRWEALRALSSSPDADAQT